MRMRLHFLLLLRKQMKYDKYRYCFSGSKVKLFHASTKRMTFGPWYHAIVS